MTDWGKLDILISALEGVEAQLHFLKLRQPHLSNYLFTISGSLYEHRLTSYFRA